MVVMQYVNRSILIPNFLGKNDIIIVINSHYYSACKFCYLSIVESNSGSEMMMN